MSTLTSEDVENLALELNSLQGARLQETKLLGDCLCLGFFAQELVWVVIDQQPISPQIMTLQSLKGIPFKDKPKPLSLFLKAHFLGVRLKKVEALKNFGRVLTLFWENGGELEVRLIPRAANTILRLGSKTIAFNKPLPLKEAPASVGPATKKSDARLQRIGEEWLATFAPKLENGSSSEKRREQRIGKLKKAMEKIESDLAEKKQTLWWEVGNWIKANQSIAAPDIYQKYIDRNKSWSWNMDNAFAKAKTLATKQNSAMARLKEIEKELQDTQSPDWRPSEQNQRPKLFQASQAQGQTFDLGSQLFFFVGKSAADNMRLLREAKPWHFWLHLRDFPGSHGIIHRQKNQTLSDAELHRAAHYLVRTKLKDKATRHDGEKYQILVAECRYIRPIKGDKLGRVNYSNARTLLHQFSQKG